VNRTVGLGRKMVDRSRRRLVGHRRARREGRLIRTAVKERKMLRRGGPFGIGLLGVKNIKERTACGGVKLGHG